MVKLNERNWQVVVRHVALDEPEAGITEKSLPDFECIQINMNLVAIKNDKNTSKLLY